MFVWGVCMGLDRLAFHANSAALNNISGFGETLRISLSRRCFWWTLLRRSQHLQLVYLER